ncbi:putative 60S ribosomal protein L26 [Paratrimastix pyriformis]|uniref:60S ribosomal protein L26 n=1 Tax=Paratrimastix pyriformis TaxID=342808 RepID=A0ABQ8UN77_9EUKA|nr:putative 60S ribosomal protein L26 [Paratrimastix pyriformis]|eukprot:EC838076.1.p2 GENE.EC838076.1~~EC838076.1.p2  ORF type:complete len:148 (+),score=41.37 EC838076.1:2-445(+)
MVKLLRKVSVSRRKARKAHFTAPSNQRRIEMSCHLSKELRQKHGVRSLPIRKDDEVRVMVGRKRKGTMGKIVAVYRKKWVVHIDRFQTNKMSGQPVFIGVHPSNCELRTIKLLKDRKDLIERTAAARAKDSDKGKIAEVKKEVQEVD